MDKQINKDNANVNSEKVNENKIYIERVSVETNSQKQIYNYMLNGKIGDRDVHADFVPKDVGGYEVLDIVFSVQPKAELIISEESMSDANGKTMKYTVYTAQTIDSDGIVYACNIKPARDSDKALLNIMLAKLALKK